MTAIVEIDGLTKKFGEFAAVQEVSLSVDEGEIFGLLGPNGAGKTTLISMLTGVLSPTSGQARIAGHSLAGDLNEAKKVIGLVPQDLALYPTLSARANLAFFGRIYGLGGKALDDRVEDVLRIVALTQRADEPVEKYSGGMKRRINIAAGLLHQPRLLFLDEPTVGVDPQSRNYIFESVRRLNAERHMTVIYTSHYMEEVELLCNRVAIMDEGRIIALDTVERLVATLAGAIRIGLRQVDDALLADLRALPSVSSATVAPAPLAPLPDPDAEPADGDGGPPEATAGYSVVQIEAGDSKQALIHVIGLMNERDIPITSLQVLEPNLENVFLHLTGKRLRE